MSILSFWQKEKEEAILMAQGLSLHDYNRTIKNDPLRWTTAGGPPNSIYGTTSMEETSMLDLESVVGYPEDFNEIPPIEEWRCEGCGSVMLKEHRDCKECGKPRHFLYRVGDDE